MSIDFVPKSFSKRLSRVITPTKIVFPSKLEENPQPILSKCYYCGETNVLRCLGCDQCFCNSSLKHSSHLFLHSKLVGHTVFSQDLEEHAPLEVHDPEQGEEEKPEETQREPIKCLNCENSDFFSLKFTVEDNGYHFYCSDHSPSDALLICDGYAINSLVLPKKHSSTSLISIYEIETSRLLVLKKTELKKNDYYNLIDLDEYQFDNEELFERLQAPEKQHLVIKSSITSPIFAEENELMQTKTLGLKNITKTHLSKMTTYETFAAYAEEHLDLLYKEQHAMLALPHTSHRLSKNMVYVPYKTANLKDKELALRLNTNYNLPRFQVGQVLGLVVESGKIFAVIEQTPTNSFNPDLKLRLLGNARYPILEDKPCPFTELNPTEVLPFDIVFSRIIVLIFSILTRKTSLSSFLTNLTLGKNFENFEFNVSTYQTDPIYPPQLNLSQKRVIENIDSNRVLLVQGHAGTGKSMLTSAIIRNLIEKDLTPVLVCSAANSTVDALCSKFHKSYRKDDLAISRLLSPFKENMYNINHPIAELCFHNFILSSAPEELIDLSIRKKVGEELSAKNEARLAKFYTDFFQLQDAIFTTCYNALDSKLENVKFRSVVIEDALTVLDILSLLPISRNPEKLVIVGDPHQIRPYVHNFGHQNTLCQSLFQRVLKNGLVKPILLTEQYRMPSLLAQYNSALYYQGQLSNGAIKEETSNAKIKWPNSNIPCLFWDFSAVPYLHREQSCMYQKKPNSIENFFVNQKTYVNVFEAERAVEIVKNLYFDSKIPLSEIAVMTTYPGQKALLILLLQETFGRKTAAKKTKNIPFLVQSKLSAKNDDYLFESHDPFESEMRSIDRVKGLEVGCVDAFQGREKEYIVFSTVRSENTSTDASPEEQWIFNEPSRLNVAISRVKKGLFVLGSSKVLTETSKYWANYLACLQEGGCVVEGGVNEWTSIERDELCYLR